MCVCVCVDVCASRYVCVKMFVYVDVCVRVCNVCVRVLVIQYCTVLHDAHVCCPVVQPRVVLVGLGGGPLAAFLNQHFPQVRCERQVALKCRGRGGGAAVFQNRYFCYCFSDNFSQI